MDVSFNMFIFFFKKKVWLLGKYLKYHFNIDKMD